MNKIQIALEKAEKESRENRKNMLHNFSCEDVDELRPFNNEEYLNLLSVVKKSLRSQKHT